MFVKLIFILVVFIPFVPKCYSQVYSEDSTLITNDLLMLIQDKNTGGTIQIYQDPSLMILLEKSNRIKEKEGLEGFRIQLYSGSEQNARDKANEISQEFMIAFPEFNSKLIYTEYQAPYFKLRVGDYRNKNEAFEFYHLVKKNFPNSYIVKSKINYPKLEPVEK